MHYNAGGLGFCDVGELNSGLLERSRAVFEGMCVL